MTNYINTLNFDLSDRIIYFIHIPKTSGTSLESEQIIKLGHCFNVPKVYRTQFNKGGFHDYEKDTWDLYEYPVVPNYKISIIRNPFDLLSSYYFHGEKLKNCGTYCHSGWASVNYTHQFNSFKQFITSYCDPNFKWHIPAFKNFLFSQLFDISYNCVTDIIIKYEYLNEAIDILNTQLKHKIVKNKKENVSINKQYKYTEYYDAEMIELVYKKCKRELFLFNYDFNGSTKYEPIIVNCNLKYDVYKDKIM
jgi:hypothetical protein